MNGPPETPPQFSLRALLVVLAAACVLLALVATLGVFGAGLFALLLCLGVAASGIRTQRPLRALAGGVGAVLLLIGPWLVFSVLVVVGSWAALHALAWFGRRAGGVVPAEKPQPRRRWGLRTKPRPPGET